MVRPVMSSGPLIFSVLSGTAVNAMIPWRYVAKSNSFSRSALTPTLLNTASMSPLCSDSGHCSQEMLRTSSRSPSDSATSEAMSTSLPTTVELSSARKPSGGSPVPTTPTVSVPSAATSAGTRAPAFSSWSVCTRWDCPGLVSMTTAVVPDDDAAAARWSDSICAELVHAASTSTEPRARAAVRERRYTGVVPLVAAQTSGRLQAGRVGLGLVGRLAGQPPALEHLLVAAVGDGAVECGADGRCQAVALGRGDGDVRGVRPAAVDLADDLEVIGLGRCLVRRGGVRAEGEVDPAGLQGQRGVGVVLVVLHVNRLEARGLVLLVPLEQDLLLVGARADRDLQPRHVRRLRDLDLRVRRGEETEGVDPVGGEVEQLLTLLGHGDVGDGHVDLAGLGRQRPVLPRRGDQFELQAECVGDQLGEVGVAADHGRVVVGVEAERGAVGRGGHGKHTVVDETGRQQVDRVLVLRGVDAVLLGAGVDDQRGWSGRLLGGRVLDLARAGARAQRQRGGGGYGKGSDGDEGPSSEARGHGRSLSSGRARGRAPLTGGAGCAVRGSAGWVRARGPGRPSSSRAGGRRAPAPAALIRRSVRRPLTRRGPPPGGR